MHNNDEFAFAERLSALYELLDNTGRDLTPNRIEIYWRILEPYPTDAVFGALDALIRTARYFPKPAEIIEQIEGGSAEELAERAVSELERAMFKVGPYESIVFSDQAMAAAVRDMGGWPRVCEWTHDDWPFRTAEFKKLYASYRRRGVPRNLPVSLPGIHENSPRGVQLIEGEMKPAGTIPALWGDQEACKRLLAESRDHRLAAGDPELSLPWGPEIPDPPWES